MIFENKSPYCVVKSNLLYYKIGYLINERGFLKIEFRDKELRRCAFDEAYALRHMGRKRAKCYKERLRAIRYAANFEALKTLAGNFHELMGNRKGQWACSLDQPYRLIIKGAEPDKVVIWAEVDEAEIIEIVDYHK